MKSNYFLKHALVVVALFSVTSVFAQTPTATTLTEIISPVKTADGVESFKLAFQSGAAWGDYNNDGYLDLISIGIFLQPRVDENGDPVLDEDGNQPNDWVRTTSLYKNNGDGSFTKVETGIPGFDVCSVIWLDYDNDGNLDLFIAGNTDPDNRYSGMWHNLGEAGNYGFEFEEAFEALFGWIHNGGGNRANHYLSAGDYNNDGWVDILMLGADEPDHSFTALYRNQGGLGFTEVALPVNEEKPLMQMRSGTIEWADLNNDGYLDILSFGYVDPKEEFGYTPPGGAIAIYINNGDGTFQEPLQFSGGEDGETATLDVNNDGKLDFINFGYSWWPDGGWQGDLYVNNGDLTWERIKSSENGLPGTQGFTFTAGDINNDGWEDIFMTYNPASIYYNKFGDTTFEQAKIQFTDEEGSTAEHHYRGGTPTLIDYDNDGDLDLFINGYDDYVKRSRLLRNDLGEGISENAAPSVPTNLSTVTADGVTTFSWDASTDDFESSVRYNLYVKQGNVIYSVLPADLTTGRLKVNETLAPLTTTSYTLAGLEGEYEWGVQAIDNAKNASKFAKIGGTGIAAINAGSVKVINAAKAIELKANAGVTGTISVYNIAGAQVYNKAGQINGTIVELPTGVYVVKVVSAAGVVTAKAIVK